MPPQEMTLAGAFSPKFQPFAQCSRRDFVLYSCGFGG